MPVALESNRHSFYHIRFDFLTATVILPLLFLSFQLSLLSFLSFFQALHETGLLHRLLFVFFQLGQQLIFVNRITEDDSLQDRDQCRDEVIYIIAFIPGICCCPVFVCSILNFVYIMFVTVINKQNKLIWLPKYGVIIGIYVFQLTIAS